MKLLWPILALGLFACNSNQTKPTVIKTKPGDSKMTFSVDTDGLSKQRAQIETKYGNITFKFYAEDAPNTSKRIAELISSKFYDGLTFHRVIPGFVAQGGDPLGNGTGGSGTKQKAEFNSRKHLMGTLSMARSANPDSADSQFYICLGAQPHLDNQYTVFGQVVEGLDLIDKIQIGDKMISIKLID